MGHKNLDAWTSAAPRMSGKGLEVLHVFFRDQDKGDDECVKDFLSGCVAAHVWWLWGSWDDECAMCFILRKQYLLHYGSSVASGYKGILENKIDYIHWSCPESLFSFWEESCEVVVLVSLGFFVVGYELPFPWSNLLILREEIKSETNPLWSIEIRQQNLVVCKDFDEEVILEAKPFCFSKTSTIH